MDIQECNRIAADDMPVTAVNYHPFFLCLLAIQAGYAWIRFSQIWHSGH